MSGTDLGSDTGTAAINATAKVVELFVALLNKIYESIEKGMDPGRRLEKAELKRLNEVKNQAKLNIKLDLKGGFVNLRTLQKSGAPLEVINLKGLDKKDIERFKEMCKREGVIVSGTFVRRDDGKLDFNLLVRAKDLERIKAVTERMNDEKRIEAIDQKIADIWKKPDMNEQDIANIKELQRQKAEIQKKYCAELNEKQAEVIVGNAADGHENKPVTLDEALNRNTGRSLDKDVYTIIADSNNPSNYVRCHGYTDTYDGKEYIKTEYEVFKDGEKVFATHDGRFDGRPTDYWATQKAAILEAGGFTGAVFKFYNETDYQRWAEYATRENTAELNNLTPGVQRTAEDYDKAVESLHEQLKERGASIGTVYHATEDTVIMEKNGLVEAGTDVPLTFSSNLSPQEKCNVAECFLIKRQIDVLTKMKAAESELAQAKAYAMVVDENTPPEQRKLIEERVSTAESTLNDLKKEEANLYTSRKELNAVQAEQNVAADRENGRIPEPEQPLQRPDGGKWDKPEEKQVQNDEQHPESMGREEVVIENDERQKTLEEWQAVVQDDKERGAEQKTPEVQKGERQTAKQSPQRDRE